MSDADDYRCFVGSLSWNTTDVDLKDAFGKFGRVTETKVRFLFSTGMEFFDFVG
jgi:heterogeneous nuclear ribonucleoprotein G